MYAASTGTGHSGAGRARGSLKAARWRRSAVSTRGRHSRQFFILLRGTEVLSWQLGLSAAKWATLLLKVRIKRDIILDMNNEKNGKKLKREEKSN